jgi:hypothetical protein
MFLKERQTQTPINLCSIQNSHTLIGNWCRFDDISVMLLVPGDEFCIAATGCNRWFAVSISNELLGGVNGKSSQHHKLASAVTHLGS